MTEAIENRLHEMSRADGLGYTVPCSTYAGDSISVALAGEDADLSFVIRTQTPSGGESDACVYLEPDEAEAFAHAILARVAQIREVTNV